MKHRLQSLILAALAHMCMPEVGKLDHSMLPRAQRAKIARDRRRIERRDALLKAAMRTEVKQVEAAARDMRRIEELKKALNKALNKGE